jgi:hypothetical protein
MAMLEWLKINANSIVQLEADSNYTNIRLIDGWVNTRSMCVNTTHASPIYFSRRRKIINL